MTERDAIGRVKYDFWKPVITCQLHVKGRKQWTAAVECGSIRKVYGRQYRSGRVRFWRNPSLVTVMSEKRAAKKAEKEARRLNQQFSTHDY